MKNGFEKQPKNEPAPNIEGQTPSDSVSRRFLLKSLGVTAAGLFGLDKLSQNIGLEKGLYSDLVPDHESNSGTEVNKQENKIENVPDEPLKPEEPKISDEPLKPEEKEDEIQTNERVESIETAMDAEFKKVRKQLYEEWPRAGADKKKPERSTLSASEYRDGRDPFTYSKLFPEPIHPGIKSFGFETRYGNSSKDWQYVEAYKYQLLTQAVERRYNLPPNILLAMMIQESGASEFLPNARNDGGFGLIHMQGSTATEFKLRTYKGCNALICDGVSEHSCVSPLNPDEKCSHAKELKNFISTHKNQRDVLAGQDERLHHLANIDAAGRILAFHIQRWPKSRDLLQQADPEFPEFKTLGPLRTAVALYCGAPNYKKGYWKNVQAIMKKLGDAEAITELQKKFNDRQSHAKAVDANNQPLTFDKYLDDWQKFYANYGLFDYVKGQCHAPANSESIHSSYLKV